MATAKFNGKSCPMCGAEFIAGESQIEPHPTARGPKGGKVWVCAEHVGAAQENPFSNAGRRTKKGQPNVYAKGKKQGQPRLPRLAAAASCDYSAMPVGTYDKASKTFSGGLVGQAAGGDAGAAAELARRGRAITGHKLAWQKKASSVRAAANPFGF